MHIDEVAQLLQPFAQLDQKQIADTLTYVNLLLKWNARMNLTAVRKPEEMVQRHFGESFFAARHWLSEEQALNVVDVGSGAGFPGLPMAIFSPSCQFTLIESNGKKAAFLNEVIRSLQLKNAKVFSQRAEAYPDKADLVTMRAVDAFESVLPTTVCLVTAGGRLGLMIGTGQLQSATRVPGLTWHDPVPVPGGHSRVLLTGTKRTEE
jgi:16S rRNA (guanine527-N7)-methyltransferase